MEFRLNLASRVYLDRRSVRRWLLLVGGLLALLLASSLLYAYSNFAQLRLVDSRLAELDARLTSQRGRVTIAYTPENFARVMGQVGAANEIIAADQFRWTALLSRLEKLLPDDVAIRSLQPNYRDHSLHITAVARDTAAMTGLLDALLASADMQQAFLLNQSPGEQPDGESVVQFTIVIREAF
jgi:Tfp pilus assembly protein PilN